MAIKRKMGRAIGRHRTRGVFFIVLDWADLERLEKGKVRRGDAHGG